MNNDNDFTNAMTRVLAYGIARINNMDMTHEDALELVGIPDTTPSPSDTEYED